MSSFTVTPFIFVSVIFFFLLAALTLSKTSRIASQLQHLVHTRVNVRVWDQPLPGNSEEALEVLSIRGFGAAILIMLRLPNGRSTLLKIAQPAKVTMTGMSFEIDHARYVQWSGSRISPAQFTKPALRVDVVS
jgi:hypothetical protein